MRSTKSILLLIPTIFPSILGLALAQGLEPRPLFVEGYTNQLSYVPGEEVSFHVSTSAKTFSMAIERAGPENVPMWEKKDIPGKEHAIPINASSNGCNWPVAFRLKIPEDWTSGY